MTPKLPRWIWPVGLALIVLNGLFFVLQGVEETPTHSSLESAVLIIGDTIGTALVVWYWGAKWMRLRHEAAPGSSLLSRISLRYRILIGIGMLAIVALGLQGFRMSFNPALRQSEDFVQTNEAVLASYGSVNDLDSSHARSRHARGPAREIPRGGLAAGRRFCPGPAPVRFSARPTSWAW
jgi:hypothetical protein